MRAHLLLALLLLASARAQATDDPVVLDASPDAWTLLEAEASDNVSRGPLVEDVDGRPALVLEAGDAWRAAGIASNASFALARGKLHVGASGFDSFRPLAWWEQTDCCGGFPVGGALLDAEHVLRGEHAGAPLDEGAWTSIHLALDAEARTWSAWVCGAPVALDEPLATDAAPTHLAIQAAPGWALAWSSLELATFPSREALDAVTADNAPCDVPEAVPAAATPTPASPATTPPASTPRATAPPAPRATPPPAETPALAAGPLVAMLAAAALLRRR